MNLKIIIGSKVVVAYLDCLYQFCAFCDSELDHVLQRNPQHIFAGKFLYRYECLERVKTDLLMMWFLG